MKIDLGISEINKAFNEVSNRFQPINNFQHLIESKLGSFGNTTGLTSQNHFSNQWREISENVIGKIGIPYALSREVNEALTWSTRISNLFESSKRLSEFTESLRLPKAMNEALFGSASQVEMFSKIARMGEKLTPNFVSYQNILADFEPDALKSFNTEYETDILNIEQILSEINAEVNEVKNAETSTQEITEDRFEALYQSLENFKHKVAQDAKQGKYWDIFLMFIGIVFGLMAEDLKSFLLKTTNEVVDTHSKEHEINTEKIYLVKDSTQLYSSPNLTSPVNGEVVTGQNIIILASHDNWVKVHIQTDTAELIGWMELENVVVKVLQVNYMTEE